ncbi:permease-like protein [Candidatus Symbiobacter mobilis CR]|uniref:Probable membrane transporter protein n=1 Tax=Candidatus Symbiobacter mobilis CR TaxID=946483 RepID=U5N810_9BURK|nr:permease-like protein [Candidatus Symbiobacter mobilis CR]
MIVVPGLFWLLQSGGYSPASGIKVAIATSSAVMVCTALSSVAAHFRHNTIRWDVVQGVVPGLLAGAGIASVGVFSTIPADWLAILYATFVVFSATQLLHEKVSDHADHAEGGTLPSLRGMLPVGTVIGFVSALVGAGGGFLSVPWLVRCNLPMRNVIATSAAMGLPIAVVSTAGYLLSSTGASGLSSGTVGYISLPALAAVGLGSLIAAPAGAYTAYRISSLWLRRAFAVLLYCAAVHVLLRTFAGT